MGSALNVSAGTATIRQLSEAMRKTYAKRRETGKELRVQVPCDEGVAIHIGPEFMRGCP